MSNQDEPHELPRFSTPVEQEADRRVKWIGKEEMKGEDSQKKKGRKRKDYGGMDIDEETFKKERGKRLARESRRRKKSYVQSLELQVAELEEKVKKQQQELDRYWRNENCA